MLSKRILSLILGPLLGIILFILLRESTSTNASLTAMVAIWMAVWWITEAIPIYFTALIPITLFPFLGIMPIQEVAPTYMPQIIFLFVGGFFLAFSLEKWNLHKRIALFIILNLGNTPKKLLFSFMLASYFLSMWILNTATVMMLLPAVIAVVNEISNQKENKPFTPFLLGIAFASSIGGTATLIGTAPNMYFMEFFNTNIREQINFTNWFLFSFPPSLVFFFISFFVLYKIHKVSLEKESIDLKYIKNEYQNLGRVSFEEKLIGLIIFISVLLWFTLRDVQLGDFKFYGWNNLFPDPSAIKESSVAMLASFALMIIPSKNQKGKMILGWKEAKKLPFGILLLFGGGFALAKGITTSGLSDLIGENLSWVLTVNPVWVIIGLGAFMTFFTELTSNTASIALMLPILATLSNTLGEFILPVMLVVTLTCSYAFMLPVATPPNTIVFGSDKLTVPEMVKSGIWLNFIGILIAFFTTYFWSQFIF
jgi:solute carrier family 13 (sodium-dependent dicarboxylate transporter), member 2/3/5